MDIDVLLFAGFDELDAVAPYEILCSAALGGAPFSVSLAGVDGPGVVAGAHGLRVTPDHAFGDRRPDLVVVPGGGWNTRTGLGARAQVEGGELPRRLAALHAEGVVVATVCTGALIAAAAGLFTGRPATTHHANLDDLASFGAEVVAGRVVDDGDLLSCGGVTSGIDLALWIVEREAGAPLAAAVAEEIEYERRAGAVAGRGAAAA